MDRLREALLALGADLSVHELLDVLWLAPRLPEGAMAPLAQALQRLSQEEDGGDPVEDRERGPDGPDELDELGEPDGPPAAEQPPERDGRHQPRGTPSGALHASADGPGSRRPARTPPEPRPARGKEPALPIRVPEAKALGRHELALSRSLRPFKQRLPTGRRWELDTEATVTAMAETGRPDVVERPARERWLDLTLVVDDGVSMLLWRRLATELRSLLQRLGAFRVIHVHGLDSRSGGRPRLRAHPFASESGTFSAAAAADPSGRTLVLVLSDGVGPAWRDGGMRAVLDQWARYGPTAVVQCLPRHMWESSALAVEDWQVTTRRRGAANRSWQVSDPLLPPELAEFTAIPVPVLEPSPTAVADWARLVASPGATATLPLLAPIPVSAAGPAEPGGQGSGQGGARARQGSRQSGGSGRQAGQTGQGGGHAGQQAVLGFHASSSPEAYRLAAHLAAVAPLSVPVMRLVQRAVPWPTETQHLAEVFLGGLMRHTGSADQSLPPQHRSFDFVDGVKEILLDTVPPIELLRTSRTIAAELTHLVGTSPDFPAWLAHPSGIGSLSPGGRPFTWLDERLLAHLGIGPMAPALTQPPATAYALPLPVGLDALASWLALRAQDLQEAGPYTMRMRNDSGTRSLAYVGEDADGYRVLIRVPRVSDPSIARHLLGIERDALVRMNGRYAPALVDEGLTNRTPWLALELATTGAGAPAPTLRAVQEVAGALQGSVLLLRLGLHLAHALSISHARGIVHGSLTPEDVLVTESSIQIINWMSARVDGTLTALPQTNPPDTPYRAPEVSYWAETRTAASDVFSLGSILAAAATGRAWRHFQKDALLRSPNFTVLEEPLRELLVRCMDADPSVRPSARTVAETFASFLPEPVPADELPRYPDPLPPAAPDEDDPASAADAERQRRLRVVRSRLVGTHRITVVAPRRGVGCTTVTMALGATLAEERRERVLAIDSDIENGAQIRLDRRVYRNTAAVLADLARSTPDIRQYEDLQLFVSEHRSGLSVLANTIDSTRGDARRGGVPPVSRADLQAIHTLAGSYYRLILTDAGALRRDTAALGLTDQVVIAGKDDEIGVVEAHRTLLELERRLPDLAARAVIALSSSNLQRRAQEDWRRDQAILELRRRCAGMVLVPTDRHLASDSVIEMSWLAAETYDAYVELAALVLEPRP